MTLTKVSGGILQQPIDVGIITATSIQVGSGTTIHDAGIDLGSGNITSHNINSTGIVTSTGLDVNGNGDISGDLSVSGNVSIGGTLTYEDVTNIDSVGLITARSGIHVTGGSVGIGTDNPQTKLDLLVGGSSGGINIHNNATGSAFYQLSTTANSYKVESIGSDLRIYDNTSTAERLRITSAGKVGINTASPRAVLDIEGNAENATLMLHSNDANANLQFSDNTGGARILNYGGDLAFRTGTNAHVFGTGDSEALRIKSNGNVGIGTDNPTFGQSSPVSTYNPKLGVEGSIIIGNLSTTASDRSELQFYRRAGTYSQSIDAHDMGRIAWYGSSNDSNNANLSWSIGVTPDGGSWTSGANRKGYMTFNNHDGEKVRITSSGVVGINTDVSGNGSGAKLVVGGRIQSNAGGYWFAGANGAEDGWHVQDSGGNLIVVESGVSERLRITSAGKVGINTSPFAELDITSTTETTTGTLSQHGIRLSAPGAADGEVIPITGGFLSNQDRARAGIGFISRVAGSSVGYAGAIGFYTRSSADGNGLLRTDEKARINESGTLIVDAGGDAQDIQIISHSGGSGHGKIYLRGNASNESSSIQLNHYGHADYHISAGRAANGLFSITRTDGGTDGIIMNANGNVGIKNTGTSSKLHIGDLVSSVSSDINTTHTSLIIKQTNNDNKGGIYIERSGERKGYYMWMNPGGGAGDALTFTRNNNGTKSNALILDRDANLTVGGHIYPSSNNTYDLGSTTNAWRNVYTNDLHLSNMSGGGNDVDGTTGDWTIQEGEENLYIINNRSGKKYKFNLQEVN